MKSKYRVTIVWPATATAPEHRYQKGDPMPLSKARKIAAKYEADGARVVIEPAPAEYRNDPRAV